MQDFVLHGRYDRLEPLARRHVDGLTAAAAGHADLYRWSPVPQNRIDTCQYVETALSWKEVGTAMPFATISVDTGQVTGSTRFWNMDRWLWPAGHSR
jgi:hypothetical protein